LRGLVARPRDVDVAVPGFQPDDRPAAVDVGHDHALHPDLDAAAIVAAFDDGRQRRRVDEDALRNKALQDWDLCGRF